MFLFFNLNGSAHNLICLIRMFVFIWTKNKKPTKCLINKLIFIYPMIIIQTNLLNKQIK